MIIPLSSLRPDGAPSVPVLFRACGHVAIAKHELHRSRKPEGGRVEVRCGVCYRADQAARRARQAEARRAVREPAPDRPMTPAAREALRAELRAARRRLERVNADLAMLTEALGRSSTEATTDGL